VGIMSTGVAAAVAIMVSVSATPSAHSGLVATRPLSAASTSTALQREDQVLCPVGAQITVENEPHYQIAVYDAYVTCPEPVVSLHITATLQRSSNSGGPYSDVAAVSNGCEDTTYCAAGGQYPVTSPDWYRTEGDGCGETCAIVYSQPQYFDGVGDVVSAFNRAYI